MPGGSTVTIWLTYPQDVYKRQVDDGVLGADVERVAFAGEACIAGAFVWAFFFCMDIGLGLLWEKLPQMLGAAAVSYTHLDVYKRQVMMSSSVCVCAT